MCMISIYHSFHLMRSSQNIMQLCKFSEKSLEVCKKKKQHTLLRILLKDKILLLKNNGNRLGSYTRKSEIYSISENLFAHSVCFACFASFFLSRTEG